MSRQRPAHGLGRLRRGRRWREALFPYMLLGPALLLLVAIFIYPLSFLVWMSLHGLPLYALRTGGTFVGAANLLQVPGDPAVRNSLERTVLFMFGAVSLEMVGGGAIALLLQRPMWGRRAIRATILLPLMLTPVVLGTMFRLQFNYLYGIVNFLLSTVGIPPVLWLSSWPWAMVSLILTDVWNQTPFVVLLLLAGLQTIPADYVEAARLDGAGFWQILRRILVPLLRPVLFVVLFWRSVATFRVFDIVFVETGGGPADMTNALSTFVSETAFMQSNLGYASAVAVWMIAAMVALAVIYNRVIRAAD